MEPADFYLLALFFYKKNNNYLENIYAVEELSKDATIRYFQMVQKEGIG